MSGVIRVTLQGSEDNHAPAQQEIDVSVVGDAVFITVFDGSLDDQVKGRKKAYEVPVLRLHDLIAALAAFGASVQGVHISSEKSS